MLFCLFVYDLYYYYVYVSFYSAIQKGHSDKFIFYLMNINYCFTLKDVLYYENKSNKDLEFIVNLFILLS